MSICACLTARLVDIVKFAMFSSSRGEYDEVGVEPKGGVDEREGAERGLASELGLTSGCGVRSAVEEGMVARDEEFGREGCVSGSFFVQNFFECVLCNLGGEVSLFEAESVVESSEFVRSDLVVTAFDLDFGFSNFDEEVRCRSGGFNASSSSPVPVLWVSLKFLLSSSLGSARRLLGLFGERGEFEE